jgi:hypothetical protein
MCFTPACAGPDTLEYGLVMRPTYVDLSDVLLCPRSHCTASAPTRLDACDGDDAMTVDLSTGEESGWILGVRTPMLTLKTSGQIMWGRGSERVFMSVLLHERLHERVTRRKIASCEVL